MAETLALKTGIFPTNIDEVKKSVFVHELTLEQKKRFRERQNRNFTRINISNKVITLNQKITELATRIKDVTKFSYLCDIEGSERKSYLEIVKEILSTSHNDCKLLSKLPSIPSGYFNFNPK